MRQFFAYVRAETSEILASHGNALEYCRGLLTEDGIDSLPEGVVDFFEAAEPDERNYAIASAYALLIGEKRRHALSAYFTPPVLARAVIEACAPVLAERKEPTVLDPACGGGSFLTPIARHLITKAIKAGVSVDEACRSALKSVRGIELDAGLAALSQALLRNTLASEYGFTVKGPLGLVRCADALGERFGEGFDLIVGNPPYSKIGRAGVTGELKEAGLANIGGHTNLYALFLLKSLGWLKPGGGLVFVLPTSFVAGPHFAGLRQEVLRRAEVQRIDLHEQRENLFLGAVQDICLLSLRRRLKDVTSAAAEHSYDLGVIDAGGARRAAGTAAAKAGGEPWTLPVANEVKAFVPRDAKNAGAKAFTLEDYGYRIRVGKVVPTRERAQLHKKRAKGDFPLLWASAIRPDGGFDFNASAKMDNAQWYAPLDPATVRYNTVRPAVIVQRTSNRDQARRLNAAAVPLAFRKKHRKGFVAENHVIVLESLTAKPRVAPTKTAALLNAAVVNERFQTVCGSFSVSAKLLERLALPDPSLISKLKAEGREHALRRLFAPLDEVLAPPLQPARDAQNSVDQPRHLKRGVAFDQNPRLKRRAVA